jgi:hypothetical protein
MPLDVRIRLLRKAPASQLVRWVTRSEPRNSVNLLRSLTDQVLTQANHPADEAAFKTLREEVTQAMVGAVSRCKPPDLHQIPLRLKQLKLSEDPRAIQIVRAILDRTSEENPEGNATRRILWDAYQYFADLAVVAVEQAKQVLRFDRLVPWWDQLCIAGMVELAEPEGSRCVWSRINISERSRDVSSYVTNRDLDRWQRFLGVVGYACAARNSGTEIAEEILRGARDLLAKTTRSDTDASQKLLTEVRRICGRESAISVSARPA